MLQEKCSKIFDLKWEKLSHFDFPISAKNIATFDFFDDYLRQFFFAEIEFYCKKILISITSNTNVDAEILQNEDAEQVRQILFDWIQFEEKNVKQILEFAIQTEINFLFNPVETLNSFVFENENSIKIDDIIEKFNFIFDEQNLIFELKEELLELQNQNNFIEKNKFSDLANDIVFKISQNQTIEEFLIPLISFQNISGFEEIPLDIISLFFEKRDLSGILNEINSFAEENNRNGLNIEEISEIIDKLFDADKNNVSEIEENFDEIEEEISNDEIDENFEIVEEDLNIEEFNSEENQFQEENINENEEENSENIVFEFSDDASEINNQIVQQINLLRSEGKTSLEITKKYFELENYNIFHIKQKIENLS